ncbi:MAG: cell wall-binding repeat-containing protein, partial [Ruminococcus sp.]|nr:cell wall-binding repeat-containing protein [Ruminococcus sp.]
CKTIKAATGKTPERVAGANRYETCVEVNSKFADTVSAKTLCVATGFDFPDALAGGVFAAMNNAPLFLVNGKDKKSTLSDTQTAYIKQKAAGKLYVIGGTGAVPDAYVNKIKNVK